MWSAPPPRLVPLLVQVRVENWALTRQPNRAPSTHHDLSSAASRASWLLVSSPDSFASESSLAGAAFALNPVVGTGGAGVGKGAARYEAGAAKLKPPAASGIANGGGDGRDGASSLSGLGGAVSSALATSSAVSTMNTPVTQMCCSAPALWWWERGARWSWWETRGTRGVRVYDLARTVRPTRSSRRRCRSGRDRRLRRRRPGWRAGHHRHRRRRPRRGGGGQQDPPPPPRPGGRHQHQTRGKE